MEIETVYRINNGVWINQNNPKINALYTASTDKNGKRISKQLAVRRVIERLIKEGNVELEKGKIEREKGKFEQKNGNVNIANKYLESANLKIQNAKNNFDRAKDLKSKINDPEYSDNNNYLKIELVKKELPPKQEPNKEKQLEFKFGPSTPLNIGEAFKKSLVREMMSADVEGVVSTHGGSVGNNDFYATGDSRVPKSIFGGVIFKRPGMYSKKKKRKKNKKDKSFVQYIQKMIT